MGAGRPGASEISLGFAYTIASIEHKKTPERLGRPGVRLAWVCTSGARASRLGRLCRRPEIGGTASRTGDIGPAIASSREVASEFPVFRRFHQKIAKCRNAFR